jgi:hypothetical protein
MIWIYGCLFLVTIGMWLADADKYGAMPMIAYGGAVASICILT